MEKSPVESNHEPKKKQVRKKSIKSEPSFDSHIERTVQLVIEKLKPEINKMYVNLKKENQNELRQLRFEIEKVRPPQQTTAGIVTPKEIVSKVNPKDLLQDPEVQKLLNQFKSLQPAGVPPQTAMNQVAAALPQVQQMQQGGGLMMLIELMKTLGGNSSGMGGGVMGEMMMRSYLAQQTRQTFLYDAMTKQLMMKLGAESSDVETMLKTSNTLMEPLKKHGESVEAAKNQ